MGERLFSRHFVILAFKSEKPTSRLGITVSRKIDKRAVVRNYVKRCVREVFRQARQRFSSNFDILVIARKNAGSIGFKETRREIEGALFHGGVIKGKQRDG